MNRETLEYKCHVTKEDDYDWSGDDDKRDDRVSGENSRLLPLPSQRRKQLTPSPPPFLLISICVYIYISQL
ncbi:hypothetical protein Ancab_007114, partial [Ancistrocladus abbreviatus]